ncbi:hypothetical protein GF1_08660 [Desulfolithobacter dissulfuricans]|uniref:Uncharacterized protein n=2 Tax=Desulfolithobacter dissulfuricans TaxID=2795293 RepID=A0A915U0E7_9BACT|nr:hypothetical protein GF1_08660 [Desulfolithobacter dissulfuricans]
MEKSMDLYRELKVTMDQIEEKLPVLDLETTLQSADGLEQLHKRIVAADEELLEAVQSDTAENMKRMTDSFARRKELVTDILEQNRKLLPKLKTRLTGYRTEILKIKNGIVTMQGYQQHTDGRGRHVNTAN